jgi:hypothetical protein
MSVPPSGRRPGSTPPSKGRRPDDEESKTEKSFRLPQRKGGVQEKDEEPKKKGLFDLTSKEVAPMQEKQPGLQPNVKEVQAKAESTAAIGEKAQITQISQLVQRMVETMRIGQIDGKDIASLDLKKGPEVPQAFAGSNLTVSYEVNGITIHFDNFMTPQQQNSAIALVEKNKEQLIEMVQALNAKNIQVHELSIGTHTVTLPRVEPLPPPFQPPPSAEAETRQQRERRDQEQGREGREQGGPR